MPRQRKCSSLVDLHIEKNMGSPDHPELMPDWHVLGQKKKKNTTSTVN